MNEENGLNKITILLSTFTGNLNNFTFPFGQFYSETQIVNKK